MITPLPARLLALVGDDDADADLVEAALLVAQAQYPTLEVADYLTRVHEWGAELRARVPSGAGVRETLDALNRLLFTDHGFGPDADNYYDPRNSFLNEVIERRRGIPLTLSILYVGVGRRAGLDLQGVSFPGHFLVTCAVDSGVVVIDPYHGGATLSLEDLQQRLGDTREGEVSIDAVIELLEPATALDVVTRMLRNLKAIYLKSKQMADALPVVDWIVQLTPELAPERRDRGLLFQELECFRAALEDYEDYLKRVPDAPDVDQIRERAFDMRAAVARLN